MAKKLLNRFMPEKQPEINQPLELLAKLRSDLGAEESLAQADLHRALVGAGVSSDVAGAYEKLEPKPGKWWQGWSLISKAILLTFGTSTAARMINEQPASIKEASRILLDNLVAWAGTSIDKLEISSIILGASAAVVWTLLPPKIYESIVQREAWRVALAEEHREGRANLAGKLGPNIHIDVGKSDPSALLLTHLFHLTGKEVVTFWDERNANFDENPYWQKTRNDWTNRDTLIRGDIQETECSVVLVSNGDDVFLSTRTQDPSRLAQDMTDSEAIGTVNARDAVRKDMSLKPIQHILVTNPKRLIEIDIARSGAQKFKPKSVGEVIEERYPNVHLIDTDQLIIQELAGLAASDNLPIEMVTNQERGQGYKGYLKMIISEHNQRVDLGLAKSKTRLATGKDGVNTLSVIYGSTDEDTIAQVETYGDQFSRSGKLTVIINDPEKVNRLPEGTNYVCVGSAVAEAVYRKFSELALG